jgi:hypothetical protein
LARLTVLYDACVLYPAPLRDFLLHLATTGLFRAKWTNEIHEEWIRSLLEARPDLRREQLERTRELMNAHVDDCLVAGYEDLIPALSLPDCRDRHVLAAAIHSGADVIVTFNLRHFPADTLAQYEIEAQHPDAFLSHLLEADPSTVCLAARQHRESLRSPPKAIEEYLGSLERQGLPLTALKLRSFLALL